MTKNQLGLFRRTTKPLFTSAIGCGKQQQHNASPQHTHQTTHRHQSHCHSAPTGNMGSEEVGMENEYLHQETKQWIPLLMYNYDQSIWDMSVVQNTGQQQRNQKMFP